MFVDMFHIAATLEVCTLAFFIIVSFTDWRAD